MKKDIEDYVRSCDSCKRKKEDREFVAPLGSVQEPTAPFEVTAIDVSGSYSVTPKGNKFLLTFIDHFSRYLEAYTIPDQKAETCSSLRDTDRYQAWYMVPTNNRPRRRVYVVFLSRNMQSVRNTKVTDH